MEYHNKIQSIKKFWRVPHDQKNIKLVIHKVKKIQSLLKTKLAVF